MSWLSENYEKAALGVAAVAVIAVGYSVLSSENKVPNVKGIRVENNVGIPEHQNLDLAKTRLANEYAFIPKSAAGNEVNSFTAYPLYSIKGRPEIDVLSNDFEIHEGMPIKWWTQYGLSDYTLANGPDLDPDKDGFTNRDEMEGGTDPTKADSKPHYLTKLKCTGAKPSGFVMSWTNVDDVKANFKFIYNGKKASYFSKEVGFQFPDAKFCNKQKAPGLLNRFEVVKRGVDPSIEGEKGQYYDIKDNLKQEDNVTKLYYKAQVKSDDWTVDLKIDINVGEVNKPFKLAEGDSFSLPFDKMASNKPFTFVARKGDKAIIKHNLKGVQSPLELTIPTK